MTTSTKYKVSKTNPEAQGVLEYRFEDREEAVKAFNHLAYNPQLFASMRNLTLWEGNGEQWEPIACGLSLSKPAS